MQRLLYAYFLLSLTGAPSHAFALTGANQGHTTPGFSLVAPSTATHSYLQQDLTHFGLASDSLLGRYGVTARQVLERYSPHLESAELAIVKVTTGADMDTVHERYELKWGRYRIFGAYINLHTHQGKLVALHFDLPRTIPPDTVPDAADYLSVLTLGFGDVPQGAYQLERRGLAVSGNFLVPAWEIERVHSTGEKRTLTLDAQTGAILSDETDDFSLAHVYKAGPNDGRTIAVELPDLLSTGYLDGKKFVVFAPNEHEPRAYADKKQFLFDPHNQAIEFDQVMAYYGVTKAESYFRENFGFSMQNSTMRVSTNTLAGGKADNAQYIPAPDGPAINIGMGNDKLQNLARETDVIFHEFTHHVIYQHVSATTGESGILHEGIADYFAYAINGDPYLGESLVPGQNYLRTGALEASWRYDDATKPRGRYDLGQILASALWDLRKTLGPDTDRIIYEALAYLPASAMIQDFLFALFNADRDLNPLAEDAPGYGVYGKNQCDLLRVLIARGFAGDMDGINGRACNVDVGAETLYSDQSLAGELADNKADGPDFALTFGGKTCSTIGVPLGTPVWLWFMVPLLVSIYQWRKRGWI